MKSGQLAGGIAIGALVGLGIGYILGIDSEKKKQWLRILSDKVKVLGGTCKCGCGCDDCHCDEENVEEVKA